LAARYMKSNGMMSQDMTSASELMEELKIRLWR